MAARTHVGNGVDLIGTGIDSEAARATAAAVMSDLKGLPSANHRESNGSGPPLGKPGLVIIGKTTEPDAGVFGREKRELGVGTSRSRRPF